MPAAAQTVILALNLVVKLVEIIVGVVSGGKAKTPDELRAELRKVIDEHDDKWLASAVAEADAKFKG